MSEKKQSEWPGLATHLSWVMHLDEEKALEATEILKQWEDPAEGAAAFNRCESPAERLFLLGFLLEKFLIVNWSNDGPNHVCSIGCRSDNHDTEIDLWQQVSVGKYRCDFMFGDPKWIDLVMNGFFVRGPVAVEIDGHEWHERSKEQATYDKKRDRLFAYRGIHILRFSGSEIYADPAKCAFDAFIAAVRHDHFSRIDAKLVGDYRAGFCAGRSLQRKLRRPTPEPKRLRLVKGNAA